MECQGETKRLEVMGKRIIIGKMPKSDDQKEDGDGQVEKKTAKQQERIMELFISSRKKGAREVDLMIEKAMGGETAPLEDALFEFFNSFRVGIYGRNHIKECILEETEAKVDIGNSGTFKRLKDLFKAVHGDANKLSENSSRIELDEEDSSADHVGLKTEPEETKHKTMEQFRQYSTLKDVDFLIYQAMDGDVIPLENAIMEFFNYFQMRIDGQRKHPTRNNVDYKSQIRAAILDQTNGKVDIEDPESFKKLNEVHINQNTSELLRRMRMQMRIDGKRKYPTENNVDYKSQIKMTIVEQMNDKVNIEDPGTLKKLNEDHIIHNKGEPLAGDSEDILKNAKNARLLNSFNNGSNTKKRLVEHFQQYHYSKTNPVDAEILIEKAKEGDQLPLENALLEFFKDLCVKIDDNKDVPPTRPNVAAYKVRLRKWIDVHSNRKVDIGNSWYFSQLDEFFTQHHDHYLRETAEDGEPCHLQEEGKSLSELPLYIDKHKHLHKKILADLTIRNRDRSMSHFKGYFSSKDDPVDVDVLVQSADKGDTTPLEDALIEFFEEYLSPGGTRSSRNTADVYKSHIKRKIFTETEGRVNIGNDFVFKKFSHFYSYYARQLKEAKREDGSGKPLFGIGAEAKSALHTLLGHLLLVLEARDTGTYEEALNKLPSSCRDTYHDLLKKAVMYIVVMFDKKRGRESHAAMSKNVYLKRYDPSTKRQWFERRDDGEYFDLKKTGIIPFHTDQFGFNPGKLMDNYLAKLHPENGALFQKTRPICKKFGLHRPKSMHVPWTPWYVTQRVGKNMICTIIPSLCKIAGVPELDDASIRATGIQMLMVLDFANTVRGKSVATRGQENVAFKSEDNTNSTESQTAVDDSPSIITERRRFRRRMQEPNESASAYFESLDAMSKSCGFSSQASLHENLLNQFIEGLHDHVLAQEILEIPDLNLKQALHLAAKQHSGKRELIQNNGDVVRIDSKYLLDVPSQNGVSSETLNTSEEYQAEEDFALDDDVFKQEPCNTNMESEAAEPNLDPLIDQAIEHDGFRPHQVFLPSGDDEKGGKTMDADQHRSASIKKSIDCRYCDFVTSTFEDLNSHMSTVHRSQPHAKRLKLGAAAVQSPHPSDDVY